MINVLEITPYEPPASGWTTRIKLLRRLIEKRGGRCEILDIGPSRLLERPDCISVKGGLDYLAKVTHFSKKGFIIHCHINGEYFRGLLLNLAALLIARAFRNRCLVTFHAGPVQPFLLGWRRYIIAPVFFLIFLLAHAVVCNSEAEKRRITGFTKGSKVYPIPAFSIQYLEYEDQDLGPELTEFISSHSPTLSTYLCYRDGFYIDVLITAIAQIADNWDNLGLVIVGTGPKLDTFRQEAASRQLDANIYIAGDLPHDPFMTILSRTRAYIRTHVMDGVSASVLEALSLGIPVIASENGTRPASVITYKADDAHELAQKLDWTLKHHSEVVASVIRPHIADTAHDEVNLILGVEASPHFMKQESLNSE